MQKKTDTTQPKISKIEITKDKISGRGGLLFFLRYIDQIRFYSLFENVFSFLKGSSKGLGYRQFVKQLFAWFIDGTDMSICSFDRQKTMKPMLPCSKIARNKWQHPIKSKGCFASSVLLGK
ncbi:MAG: hypothetical protein U5R06_18270 [candidate division KSB1 bacterium]|nr:hypothetical protein [candidate division KSB1 bacterium]